MAIHPRPPWLMPRRSARVGVLERAVDAEAACRAEACRELRATDRALGRAARATVRDIRCHGLAGDDLRALEAAIEALEDLVVLGVERTRPRSRGLLAGVLRSRPPSTGRSPTEFERRQDTVKARRRRCRERGEVRVLRFEWLVERRRRCHLEIVLRARAAGAAVDEHAADAIFARAADPLRDLVALMERGL